MGVETFLEQGYVDLGNVLPEDNCGSLLREVRGTREFSSRMFLDEAVYRSEEKHKGVNPEPGRNLTESFDLSWIEENSRVVDALTRVLGPGYRIAHKKFVIGVPDGWLPPWLLEETRDRAIANLGAYVRPEYRDITYFHGIDFHQDIIDHTDRFVDYVTLYVYLEDVSEDASPLFIVPGSHLFGATVFPHDISIHKDKENLTYSDRRGQSAVLRYQMLTGTCGVVYFWHSCVLHGTQPHLTSTARISLRYTIEKGTTDRVGMMDEVNQSIQGPLSLSRTRKDLDDKGAAQLTGNWINKARP